MSKNVIVTIECNLPDGITNVEFTNYVKEAVSYWSGQYHPDHPLFGWFRQRGNAILVKTRKHTARVTTR